MILGEGVRGRFHAGILAGAVVVALHKDVALVELYEIAPVAAYCHMAVLHVTVQALRGFLSGGNRVDRELGAGEAVATHEYVGIRRLIGKFVRHGIHAAEEFHLGACKQVFQDNSLADCEDNHISIEGNQLIFIIFRGELVFCVENGSALLENDSGDLAVAQDLLRAPAGIQHHSVLAGLGALFEGCGHDVFGLQREHRNLGGTAALGHAGRVDGHVSAAHDDHLAAHLHLAAIGIVKEIDGSGGAGESLAGDTGQTSALAADSHVEALVAFFPQAGDSHILPHLDSATYVHPDLTHNINLRLYHVLLQFI